MGFNRRIFILKCIKFILLGFIFRIFIFSEPICILLPIETVGILETYISVVNPADGDAAIVDIVFETRFFKTLR